MNSAEIKAEIKSDSTKFASRGLGLKKDSKLIGAKFPEHITEILDKLPNKAAYVRNAVVRQLKQDGYID
ncbi:MAG: hypothetical protein AAFS12_00075 [Cyanobacteria bacterium J06632_19]